MKKIKEKKAKFPTSVSVGRKSKAKQIKHCESILQIVCKKLCRSSEIRRWEIKTEIISG